MSDVAASRRGGPPAALGLSLVLAGLLLAYLGLLGFTALHGGAGRAVLLAGIVAGVVANTAGAYVLSIASVPVSRPAPAVPRSDEYSVLAIVAFVLSLPVSLVGIVLGHVALREIRRTGKRGRGLAVAALVLGYGLFALFGISLLVLLALRP